MIFYDVFRTIKDSNSYKDIYRQNFLFLGCPGFIHKLELVRENESELR